MTNIQLIAHQEQVDAARAEFLRKWAKEERNLIRFGMDPKRIIEAQIRAWKLFKANRITRRTQ
jgi:hypothetical protein